MAQHNRIADAALDDILTAAGVPKPPANAAAIAGDDPVLPTPFRIGAAGAAALAATG